MLEIAEDCKEYQVVRIRAEAGKQKRDTMEISWELPCMDIFSSWSPLSGFHKDLLPVWAPAKVQSRIASGAPLLVLLNHKGESRIMVALSETRRPVEMTYGIREENACMVFSLTYSRIFWGGGGEYVTEILIDRRSMKLVSAAKRAEQWWKGQGRFPAEVPPEAKLPAYSTWYAWHQKFSEEELLGELAIAAEMGMHTVIVDDGWQTRDTARGYAYCGDWKPAEDKIRNMRRFVSRAHQLGLKVMLWFAVPVMGKKAAVYPEFCKMYLADEGDWVALDPRCPAVRNYLLHLCKEAVERWELDGLKLDFMDHFVLTQEGEDDTEDRDFDSLEDALECLMEEFRIQLQRIRKNVLVELRQGYMGPDLRKYGNIIRVTDCPLSALRNRVEILHLRMTSGNTAVHSDMLMWNAAASAQAAALQLINSIFGIWQISVRLKELPHEHKRMLQFYLGLWSEDRDCILNGELEVFHPEANYSMVLTKKETELFAVCYTEGILQLDTFYRKITYVNGSGEDVLTVHPLQSGFYTGKRAKILIYSCTGELFLQKNEIWAAGYYEYPVPVSGVLRIYLE